MKDSVNAVLVLLFITFLGLGSIAIKSTNKIMDKLKDIEQKIDPCLVNFSESMQSIHVHKSKVIPHKGIKPNSITILCGEDKDE